jgi:hypothetical protein
MSRSHSLVWFILTSFFIVNDDICDRLRELPRKRSRKDKRIIYLVLSAFWLSFILLTIFTISYFFSRSTVFTVSANIEQFLISPFPAQQYPIWKFQKTVIHPDCGPDHVQVSGILHLDSTAFVEFLRIQSSELTINLETDDADSVGTFVTSDGEALVLEDCAVLRLNANNTSFVFPVEGDIKLGGEIKENSISVPILYSGDITILDKALITREYYSVGPFSLNMGDVFVIDELDLKSSGFVQIDSEKGMKVTYSSKGNRGYIKKYKTEDIEIKNGFWTKIYNDPSLIIIWFIGIGIYAISKTIIRINLDNKS